MSEIDDATVIANQRETIRRLIEERDEWRRKAEMYSEARGRQTGIVNALRRELAQKGDQQ